MLRPSLTLPSARAARRPAASRRSRSAASTTPSTTAMPAQRERPGAPADVRERPEVEAEPREEGEDQEQHAADADDLLAGVSLLRSKTRLSSQRRGCPSRGAHRQSSPPRLDPIARILGSPTGRVGSATFRREADRRCWRRAAAPSCAPCSTPTSRSSVVLVDRAVRRARRSPSAAGVAGRAGRAHHLRRRLRPRRLHPRGGRRARPPRRRPHRDGRLRHHPREADPRRVPRPHRQHASRAAARVQGLARGRRRARGRREGHRLHRAPRAARGRRGPDPRPGGGAACSPTTPSRRCTSGSRKSSGGSTPRCSAVARRRRTNDLMRALLSVCDKTGLVEFARGLHELGVGARVVGRHRQGDRRGRHPRDARSPTSPAFPEMLDHRVVTLHPKVHGGILADRGKPSHHDDMEQYGIAPFDMVVTQPLPVPRVARHRDHRHRRPGDDAGRGEEPRVGRDRHRPRAVRRRARGAARATARSSDDTRRALALEAFARTAAYDAAIVAWLAATTRRCPQHLVLALERTGEAAALRREPAPAGGALPHRGHHELVGRRRAAQRPRALATSTSTTPTPRGASSHDLGDRAHVRDHQARQPVRRRGRRRPRHRVPARARVRRALRVRRDRRAEPPGRRRHRRAHGRGPAGRPGHRARATTTGTIEALRKKRKNTRLLEAPPPEAPEPRLPPDLAAGSSCRTPHHFAAARDDWRVVTKRAPTEPSGATPSSAWRICGHVKSNAIVLVKDGQAVGIGAGQQNRVRVGRDRGQEGCRARRRWRVRASDAFYPFPDGIEAAAAAGVAVVVQPGGSVRRREGHRAGRRARPRDGVHRREALPPLMRRRSMTAKMMPGGPVADAVFEDLMPRSREADRGRPHDRARHHPRRRRRRSVRYVGMKMEKAQELGWTSPHNHLPEDATQADVHRRHPRVQRRSRGRRLPRAAPHAAADRLRRRAARDGSRQGRRRHAPGEHGPAGADDARARCPCTPAGIEALLAFYEIPVAGHEVCILGRGTTLGRPLALLLSQKRPTANAAVTVVHTGVPDWPRVHAARRDRRRRRRRARHPPARAHHARARSWSVAACATRAASCSPTSTSACEEVAGAITPRVGGVGPTTIAMLFRNAVEAAERKRGQAVSAEPDARPPPRPRCRRARCAASRSRRRRCAARRAG